MQISRRGFVTGIAGGMGAASLSAELLAADSPAPFTLDPNLQYMMPAHFGKRPRGRGSADYLDVTTLAVGYLTDRAKLARYLPAPFEPAAEPLVSVFYSMNREIEWLAGGSYNILGVNAAAVFQGDVDHVAGAYCLVLWEDETDPILTGRELLGIPKIYADIEDHSVFRGQWRTSAAHRGHKIVDMSIGGLTPLPEEEVAQMGKESADANWMGWKYIPNTGRPGAAVSHATLVPTAARPREVWTGKGKIAWHSLTWEQNPTQFHIVNALAGLPIVEYRHAVVIQGATSLSVPGKSVRELH